MIVIVSESALLPSVAWTTRSNEFPVLDSSSMSSQSATVMIPVAPAIVKASVLSESVSSLPLVIDHVRPVISPVVARSTTVPEQDVDSARLVSASVTVGFVLVIVTVIVSVSALLPSVAWTTRSKDCPVLDSASRSSQSATVTIPVDPAIVKALVLSPSVSSLPL